MFVEWRAAVLGAAVDADRFLRRGKELDRDYLQDHRDRAEASGLVDAAAPILGLDGIEKGWAGLSGGWIGSSTRREFSRRNIRAAPGFSCNGDEEDHIPRDEEDHIPPPELTVAFVRFTVDGQPAGDTHFLTPKETHDLEIEVRVSRWPDSARALCLAPVTIEARSTHDFPTFRFSRPSGDPPYQLRMEP